MADETRPRVDLFYTPEFKRNLRHLSKKYPHVRTDIQPKLDSLAAGQREGDKIPGVKFDVHKVRAKNRDAKKGKSGGYRLIYQVVKSSEIVLVTAYSKTEQGDITANEIRRIIEEFEKEVE